MMTFNKFWKENAPLYTLAGVKEEVAKTIWDAACNSMEAALLVEIAKMEKK
jgi:hypothetical protein